MYLSRVRRSDLFEDLRTGMGRRREHLQCARGHTGRLLPGPLGLAAQGLFQGMDAV